MSLASLLRGVQDALRNVPTGPARQGRRKRVWRELLLELLEDRTAPTVTLTGFPTWESQGPGPITGGQVEGIDKNPVSGAISAIAVHPTDPNTVYVGSVGGGIWKTTQALNTDEGPNWTPKTDSFLRSPSPP